MCHSFSSITLILYRYFKWDRAWQSWCYDSESSHIFKKKIYESVVKIHFIFLNLLLIIFYFSQQLNRKRFFFLPIYSFVTLVFYSNMYCSILTMMAIGIDRYLGIVRPMLFRRIRKKRLIAFISCFVMWGLVLSTLYPLMTTDLTYRVPQLNITTCFDILKTEMLPSMAAWAAFLFSMVFVLFLFPFCVTSFCYISVIRKLASDSKTSQKKRAIRLAVIVLLVFTLCFGPNNILLLIHSVLRLYYKKSIYTAYKLSLCFSCLNSCLDPFIYYFACKDFRQKLREIIHLQSLSSGDSMKMENKETLYSAQWGQEWAQRKVFLKPQSPQHRARMGQRGRKTSERKSEQVTLSQRSSLSWVKSQNHLRQLGFLFVFLFVCVCITE